VADACNHHTKDSSHISSRRELTSSMPIPPPSTCQTPFGLSPSSPSTKVSELSPSSPLIKAITNFTTTKIAWRRLYTARRKLPVNRPAARPLRQAPSTKQKLPKPVTAWRDLPCHQAPAAESGHYH